MTREEAIFCEKSYIGETNCVDCSCYKAGTCKSKEAHKMAIKALEQEPYNDAISRQTVLNTLSELNAISFYEAQADSKECYYEIRQAIESMSSAIPQQKTGHWIDKTRQSACGVVFYRIECSECGEASGLSHTFAKYCPNCGAKMGMIKQ